MITWLQQPAGSKMCGQTCVAMLAGITLEESIAAFEGKKSSTRTRDLVTALRKLGIACGDVPLIRIKEGQEKPKTCIVKLHFSYTTTLHWVIWHQGKFYDPSAYAMWFLENHSGGQYWEGVRETSFLPIHLLEDNT